MNKRAIAIIVALVVVVVGAVGAYAATRPSETSAAQGSAGTTSVTEDATAPDTGAAKPVDVASTPGAYVDYSDSAIADAQGRTFLFFHATWCPSCRAIEKDILASGVPAGITVIKVDYDSHQDLRQKYGVAQQTTFVEVDAAGNGLQNFLPTTDLRLQAVLDVML